MMIRYANCVWRPKSDNLHFAICFYEITGRYYCIFSHDFDPACAEIEPKAQECLECGNSNDNYCACRPVHNDLPIFDLSVLKIFGMEKFQFI